MAAIIIAVALAYALYRGATATGRAVKSAATGRADRWRAGRDSARDAVANGSGATARKAGRGVGGALHAVGRAGRILWHAFREGWGEGWVEGRARGERLVGRIPPPVETKPATEPEPEPATEPAPEPEPEPEKAPAVEDSPKPPADDDWLFDDPIDIKGPNLQVIHGGKATPQPKEKEMPIETVTGGENITMDQMEAELQAMHREALAELEDAQGDERRATADVTRVDNMVTSAVGLHAGPKTIGDLTELAQMTNNRKTQATNRVISATARAEATQAALTALKQRHGLLQNAHDNTEHAADNSFYDRV